MNTTLTDAERAVFYLPPLYHAIYSVLSPLMCISGGVMIGAGFFFALITQDVFSGFTWISFLTLLFCGILGIFMILVSFRLFGYTKTQLILSPHGIVLDTFWEVIQTPWENVERIGTIPIGLASSEAFLLRKPPQRIHRWGAFPFLGFQSDSIPMSGFGRSWGDDRVANAIRRYAPSLLKEEMVQS
jgi:hypothetical protein